MEELEPRIAPAGIISIGFSRGVLSITGDQLDNQLEISQIDEDSFLISPLSGTEVRLGKGPSGIDPVTVDGVTRAIKISLRGGSDTLTANELNLNGDLNIDMGTSISVPDILICENLLVDGSVRLKTGGITNLDFTSEELSVGKDLIFRGSKTGSWNVSLPNGSVEVGGNLVFLKTFLSGSPANFSVGENMGGTGGLLISGSAMQVGENFGFIGNLFLGDFNSPTSTTLTVGENFFASTTGTSALVFGNFLVGESARIHVKGDAFALSANGGIGEDLTIKSTHSRVILHQSISIAGRSSEFSIGDDLTFAASGAGNWVQLELALLEVGDATRITSSTQYFSAITNCELVNLNLKLSGKDDHLVIESDTFSKLAKMNTGGGNDIVSIFDTNNRFEGGLLLAMGDGADTANLGDLVNQSVEIFFGVHSSIIGGKGNDTINFVELKITGAWEHEEFETINPI